MEKTTKSKDKSKKTTKAAKLVKPKIIDLSEGRSISIRSIKPGTRLGTAARTVKTANTSGTGNVNDILIDNFVNLQRALTNLSVKFDNLADQISKLLQLFEISAKSFTEKQRSPSTDREMAQKINTLLEQNKIIAKGLTLLEQRIGKTGAPQALTQSRMQPSIRTEPEKQKKPLDRFRI